MNSGPKTTIDSLARELGISASTVSRALNGYPDISVETRRRVREAADLAGYRVGDERKGKRVPTNIVGLVVEVWTLDISSPFFGQFLRGATSALRRAGFDLMVASTDGPNEALKTYEYLVAEGKIDGFILTRIRSEDPRIALLTKSDIPFVCYGRDAEGDGYAWHDVDAAQAAAESVDYLVRLGHRRIGLVQAPSAINFVRLRREAYRSAMEKHGLDADARIEVEAGLTAADGAEATRKLLALDEPPTALVCDLDALALGAMAVIRELGLTPGRDISVVGYGDDPFSEYAEPPLTTFSQDSELAGRWVAEMVLAILSGTTPAILQRERPAIFVERLSAAAPTGGPKEVREAIDKGARETAGGDS